MDVELPPPDELVARIADPARRRPLAVLDPSWPSNLCHQAASDLAAAHDEGRLGANDLVLFTSGSTGRPRGVVRTMASWVASLQPLSALTEIGAADVVWLPGPLTSSLSLYGAFHAAAVGATSGVLTHTATAAHLVPAVLADAVGSPHLFPRLRTVVVAGEALSDTLRDRATGLGWRVVEYYGAAELSFVGVRDGTGPMRAFPGAQVELRQGRVWVRSPYLARGYLRAHDTGPLVRDGEWAGVGDLGRQVDDGWVVSGRGDTAIVTGGHTVVAEDVEAVLAAVEGVKAVAVIGLSHERLGQYVAAVVVADRPVRSALVMAVAALPAPARPRRWLAIDRLPHTGSGKVARGEVLALAGDLPRLR